MIPKKIVEKIKELNNGDLYEKTMLELLEIEDEGNGRYKDKYKAVLSEREKEDKRNED